jgi:TolB-like protein
MPDPSLLGRTLSHYRIERLLGAGGMGAVYLAQDLALGRQAALKVVGDRLDAAMRLRLLREAEANARLQHPAIATFFESGESDGISFIALEYVRGETLRERLVRGSVPLAEALAIGSWLLEAVNHAHAAGILHRDLKPENIMLTPSGGVKLLDFGLARVLVDDPGTGATVTNLSGHLVLGTVGYMAPEQLTAGEVDQRVDVFSVGAVLYEMVSGRPAFPGRSPTERLAALLTRDPDPLDVPDLPPELDGILRRALDRDAARRHPTASALLADLRGLGSPPAGGMGPAEQTLAVLDFRNLSQRPEDEWLGSGIAESLTTDLARVPGLFVVSRARVLTAAGRTAGGGGATEPLAIGSLLGCRWVLFGGFQHMGHAVRLTAELVEVATGRAASRQKLDGTLDEIFDMQDRLSSAVTASLHLRVPTPVRPASEERHVQAFECYARGRRLFLRLEKGGFDSAQALYERAIEAEPGHARALAGLAGLHAMRYTFTTDAGDLDLAEAYATRASAADPLLPEPLVWRGYVQMRRGLFDEAIATESRADALDRDNPYPPYFTGCARVFAGQPRASLPDFQRAVLREPPIGFAWIGLAVAHLSHGRLDEARWCLGEALALERSPGGSNTVGVRAYVGECLRLDGHLDEARRECLAGLEAVEQSDHMFRDSFRCAALCSLARTAMDQGDLSAARAAAHQVLAQLAGRPRTLGGGLYHTQALTLAAWADADPRALDEALAFYRDRPRLNFDALWFDGRDTVLTQLGRAARALGREIPARDLLQQAARLGSYEATRLLGIDVAPPAADR